MNKKQTSVCDKVLKGFTLIELLVVVAIIALLSTVIATPIMNARKKAADTRKVADLNAIRDALISYADTNGSYPLTLANLVPTYLPAVPTQAQGTANLNSYFYTTYCSAATCNATNVIGYHLYARLDVAGNAGLSSDSDCGGPGGAAATSCITTVPTGIAVNLAPNAATAGLIGSSATDIAVNADNETTVCGTTAASPCVYDLSGQL